MYIFPIVQVESHVRDFAGGVAEEQEVSCLTFVPLFCRHDVAGESLLRSIAGENDSGRKIGRFDKSRTVGTFDRSAAPEVSRSHHSFGGLYDFIHVYGSRCPLGEFATFVVFQESGSSIGERYGYELFSRFSCGLQNTARYDIRHGLGIFICGSIYIALQSGIDISGGIFPFGPLGSSFYGDRICDYPTDVIIGSLHSVPTLLLFQDEQGRTENSLRDHLGRMSRLASQMCTADCDNTSCLFAKTTVGQQLYRIYIGDSGRVERSEQCFDGLPVVALSFQNMDRIVQ